MKKRKPGAGRPNELGQTKLVAIRLPTWIIKDLEKLAKVHNTSTSGAIRQILETHLS